MKRQVQMYVNERTCIRLHATSCYYPFSQHLGQTNIGNNSSCVTKRKKRGRNIYFVFFLKDNVREIREDSFFERRRKEDNVSKLWCRLWRTFTNDPHQDEPLFFFVGGRGTEKSTLPDDGDDDTLLTSGVVIQKKPFSHFFHQNFSAK